MNDSSQRKRFDWPQEVSYFAYVVSILILAVFVRFTIFGSVHNEGDEVIYRALIEQLFDGRGFTLIGHSILSEPWISKEMYSSPIFFHPPVGIYFFQIFQLLFGKSVFALCLAQLFSFSIFYFCTIAILKLLFSESFSKRSGIRYFLPLLLAFTPIYAHTNTKLWIDNPRVAFLSIHFLSVLLFVRSPRNLGLCIMSFLTSFLVVLSKIDGIVALPFVYWFVIATEANHSKNSKKIFMGLIIANFIVVALWLYVSEAFKYGPGRPSAELLAMNSFVHFVTIETTSLDLVENFFKVTSTFLPSILVIFLNGKVFEVNILASRRMALILWVVTMLALYFILGLMGYSKVIRYLVYAVPATCLLFAYALNDLSELFERWENGNTKTKGILVALSILLFISFNLEITQGLNALMFQTNSALILPVF